MKKTFLQGFIIGRYTFDYIAAIFIIAILTEHLISGLVSQFININLFLAIVLAFGLFVVRDEH